MSGQPAASETVHATAVLVGEHGLLLRGASGAGKSSLAARLVAQGLPDGCGGRLEGRLVADDRVLLSVAAGGRLVARPHPAIAGLVERRGEGLGPVRSADAMLVRAVIDLAYAESIPRLPEPEALAVTILGVRLPRLWLLKGGEAYGQFVTRAASLFTRIES
jgi:serine kinase of HPr protein (carbohydrate metabolism regulator)